MADETRTAVYRLGHSLSWDDKSKFSQLRECCLYHLAKHVDQHNITAPPKCGECGHVFAPQEMKVVSVALLLAQDLGPNLLWLLRYRDGLNR